MAAIQNANPTVRNTSDLPTRRQRASSPTTKKHALGLFASAIPSSTYPVDPFEPAPPSAASDSDDDDAVEPIDEQEIYDLISTISDPEHPLSLGSLAVVNLPDIHITPLARDLQTVLVEITPTITHCSLATVIGLGVRVRLEQSLPPRFRVDVRIKEGTHSTGDQVNKQLGDKERVAAALENAQLMGVLRKMLETCR
ncbi:hypothetical protein MMC18_008985 [Xylographa bjoerkii]|nr:hypothetical protein [Xylographa bjoerkii]